jgi:hypothetical protein
MCYVYCVSKNEIISTEKHENNGIVNVPAVANSDRWLNEGRAIRNRIVGNYFHLKNNIVIIINIKVRIFLVYYSA